MLALYGHAFSSYTWKARIALFAAELEHAFRSVDPEHPENAEVVASASPLGKFPVLDDGGLLVFEATTIIEHIALHHAAGIGLLPTQPDAAIRTRQMDRVFDNYVMTPMQDVVSEYLLDAGNPDAARVAQVRERLARSYAWLENWLAHYPRPHGVTLIECAAAPSLFYADWVLPIAEEHTRLRDWRAHLLALPEVSRCVEEARPFRAYFPLGAPDRD